MSAEHPDPVVDEIHAIRREISARVGHDTRQLVAYYVEQQKRHGGRLVGSTDLESLTANSTDNGNLTR